MSEWQWARTVDRAGLARYVMPDLVAKIANLTFQESAYDLSSSVDGRRRLAQLIYDGLLAKAEREERITYDRPKYNYEKDLQTIRTPEEILVSPREGTCLDLSLLYAGLCLHYGLLPLVILLNGHAYVAVNMNCSRTHNMTSGWKAFSRKELEKIQENEGFLTDEDRDFFAELINNGDYLPIECTGFAYTQQLPVNLPEGQNRFMGYLPFEQAVKAGQAQLEYNPRPFRYAAAIHYLQQKGVRPQLSAATFLVEGKLARDPQLAFKGLFSYHAKYFGGREPYIEEIQKFSQGKEGYLLVQGIAGFGKTALMAYLCQSSKIETAYYFFNSYFSTKELDFTLEKTFLELIVPQLAKIRGERPIEGSLNLVDLRAFYNDCLTQPTKTPFLLILDGLDEAAFSLVNYFPNKLGTNVHVLATVRPEADHDWPSELSLDRQSITSLTGLLNDDIAAILTKAGSTAAALAVDSAFVQEIACKSKRDPFYVRFLAEDIEKGQIKRTDLSDIPDKVNLYLERWWEQLTKNSKEFIEEINDIVCLIFVAKGPLSRADIIACLGSIKPGLPITFKKALAQIERFLIGNSTAGYQFCHSRFRNFLAETGTIPPQVAQRYLLQLLNFCESWNSYDKPSEVPEYILAYYPRHLIDLEDPESLIRLLSKEWIELKLKRYETHYSFSEDLKYAIEYFSDSLTDNWAYLVRAFIQESILAQKSQDLPISMIIAFSELGDLKQALEIALLTRTDLGADSQKASLLAQIAEVSDTIGREEESKELQILALNVARRTKDIPFSVKALVHLAMLCGRTDSCQATELLDEALEATEKLPDNTSWKKALCYVLIAEQTASISPEKGYEVLRKAFETMQVTVPNVEFEPRRALVISELRSMDDLAAWPLNESLRKIVTGAADTNLQWAQRIIHLIELAIPNLQSLMADYATSSFVGRYLESVDYSSLVTDLREIFLKASIWQNSENWENHLETLASINLSEDFVMELATKAPEKALQLTQRLLEPLSSKVKLLAALVLAESDPDRAGRLLAGVDGNDSTLNLLVDVCAKETLNNFRPLVLEKIEHCLLNINKSNLQDNKKFDQVVEVYRAYQIVEMPVEAEQYLTQALSFVDMLNDARDRGIARLTIAMNLFAIGDPISEDVIAPLLIPPSEISDPANYACFLGQAAAYVAPYNKHFAERLIEASDTVGSQASLRQMALDTESQRIIGFVARTMIPWKPNAAREKLKRSLLRHLQRPVSKSYYFNWCLAKLVPATAPKHWKYAEEIVRNQRNSLCVPTLAKIAQQIIDSKPDEAARILRVAIKQYGASNLEEIFSVAYQLPSTLADSIVKSAQTILNDVKPDKHGSKVNALIKAAIANAEANNDLARQLLDQAFDLAIKLDDPRFQESALVKVVTARIGIGTMPDERYLRKVASALCSRYWSTEFYASIAEWYASQGEIEHACRYTEGNETWASRLLILIRMAVTLPETFKLEKEQILTYIRDNADQIRSPYDHAWILIAYADAVVESDADTARAVINESLIITERLVENLFGTRSKLLTKIAKTVSNWDPFQAVTMLESVFVGSEVEVLPLVIERWLKVTPESEAVKLLPEWLQQARERSLDSQLVLFGSLTPLVVQIGGEDLVKEMVDNIVIDLFGV